jgi:hypothetical protein
MIRLSLPALKIGKLTLPDVYVVGDELGDETVLGRNVLDELRLLLDGPQALMTLLDAGAANEAA